MHWQKYIVWCRLWAGEIISSYFLKTKLAASLWEWNERFGLGWHVDSTGWNHMSYSTWNSLLQTKFLGYVISQKGNIDWSSRFCDLTPLDRRLSMGLFEGNGLCQTSYDSRSKIEHQTLWKVSPKEPYQVRGVVFCLENKSPIFVSLLIHNFSLLIIFANYLFIGKFKLLNSTNCEIQIVMWIELNCSKIS